MQTLESSAVDSVLSALLRISRVLKQRHAEDTIEPSLFWLLRHLSEHVSLRVTELAARAALDPSTVSRHLTQLEKAGLVLRVRDPLDRRAQRVTLSETGRQLLSDGFARRRELLSRNLDRWDAADLTQLAHLLARFVVEIETNPMVESA